MTESRPCRICGSTDDVHPYLVGPRCPDHTPAAMAGRPEPNAASYCPPAICWCGTCPWAAAPVPATPAHTAIDDEHIRSGKRSTNRRGLVAARLNQTARSPR